MSDPGITSKAIDLNVNKLKIMKICYLMEVTFGGGGKIDTWISWPLSFNDMKAFLVLSFWCLVSSDTNFLFLIHTER